MGVKENFKKWMKPKKKIKVHAFWVFEGERVKSSAVLPGGLAMEADRHWRPEGEDLPPFLEIIPGYQRPQNWRELEEGAEKQPTEVEFDGKRRRLS